jgi:hypothetical protein
MLAGVAFIGRSLLPSDSSVGGTLHFLAIALLAVGMVGLHALQKDHYGLIGRAGFYIVVIAALAMVGVRIVILLSGSETLYWLLDIGDLGLVLGFVLYGVATLQARVLPLWCGVWIIVALPLRIALFPIDPWGLTLFGLLWGVLGYVLWSRREAVAEQPSRVS